MNDDIKERLRWEPHPLAQDALGRIEALEAQLAGISEECAKIAESHVGALGGGDYGSAYSEACRDIAKAIRDEHGSSGNE